MFFLPHLAFTSLTQVAGGLFVPRPGGGTCEVFPHGAGEVDIEEVGAVGLQGLLQLLHAQVCPGEHAEMSHRRVGTQNTENSPYSESDAPSQHHALERQTGRDQAAVEVTVKGTIHIWDVHAKINNILPFSTVIFI